jgi:hypothetical protein
MQNGRIDTGLRLVRHELDMLAEARMLGELGPMGEARYQELCRIERDLLGSVAA